MKRKMNFLAIIVLAIINIILIFLIIDEFDKKDEIIEENNIALSINNLNLSIGESKLVTYEILPNNATYKDVTWNSSNTNIAIVDDGLITAKGEGKTIVTITSHHGKKDILIINVGGTENNTTPVKVKGIILSQESITIKEGEKETLTAEIIPNTAEIKTYKWFSSNSEIATVDENGVVKGVSAGQATITVTSTDGGYTDTCSIIVNSNTVSVSSITLNKTSQSLKVGGTVTLTATVKPDNATNKGVNWTSSNSNVVTVNNGIVKAVGVGTAYVYVTSASNSNVKVSCLITVNPNTISVSSITLNKTSQSLKVGGTVTLTATVKPDNATNKGVNWTSSNSNVVTVNNGIVKAVGVGTAYVYVTSASNSNIRASCLITVTQSVNPPATTSANLRTGYSLAGEYNSDTLKFWVEKGNAGGSTVYVAHIWVKDAYNQLKTALSSNWGKGFQPSTTIFQNEIASKSLTNKGVIAINASGMVSGSYSSWLFAGANGVAGIPEWKYTSVSPIVIHDGKVLRNFTNRIMPEPLYSVSGLKKDGWIYQYDWSKGNNISYNQNVANQIISDGVKYTWGFVGFLIKDGKINYPSSDKAVAYRSAIGQIDKNNFVLVSGGSFTLYNLANYLKNNYNCVQAINLDGGGSSSMSYKLKGTNEIIRLRKSDRAITDILYFSE